MAMKRMQDTPVPHELMAAVRPYQDRSNCGLLFIIKFVVDEWNDVENYLRYLEIGSETVFKHSGIVDAKGYTYAQYNRFETPITNLSYGYIVLYPRNWFEDAHETISFRS
jgi:hypothetical protein